ncbi:MAG TPA: hypothetical protein VGI39_04970 [Polyangiaceae bacterium]
MNAAGRDVAPIEELHVLREIEEETAKLPPTDTTVRLLATVLRLREQRYQAGLALSRAIDRAELLDAALQDARGALAVVGGG